MAKNQKKINRNNRQRGANFEKKVADYLDMFVVPYSGSNARYGYGDIRDSEGINGGTWLGECKNRKCDDIFVIERDWWKMLDQRSCALRSHGFLAFMKSGRAEKYIMLHLGIFENLYNVSGVQLFRSEYIVPRLVHNTTNYRIPMSILNINTNTVLIASFEEDNHFAKYAIIRIETFKFMLQRAPQLHSVYCKRSCDR